MSREICFNCKLEADLVHSGIDAFMLGGILTGLYCYECANAAARGLIELKALEVSR